MLLLPAVPCPYFIPAAQLAWPNAPRLPLGDAYLGQCCADDGLVIEPGILTIRDLCNLGYARGRCSRFPTGDGPDAVRFAVVNDSAGVIRIAWVLEKDHHPVDHGRLEYSIAESAFLGVGKEAVLRLARAYVVSYLRRKAAAA